MRFIPAIGPLLAAFSDRYTRWRSEARRQGDLRLTGRPVLSWISEGDPAVLRFVLLKVAIYNGSDVGASLEGVYLDFRRGDDEPLRSAAVSVEVKAGRVKLASSHWDPNPVYVGDRPEGWFGSDVNIPPHESRSGWFVFPMPPIPLDQIGGLDTWLVVRPIDQPGFKVSVIDGKEISRREIDLSP